MTMKRRTTMSCLPREILVDIISRLPMEELSRCRFVNKDWKNLFTDPIFIELCNSRINKDDPLCLLLCRTSKDKVSELYLVNNENHDTNKLTASKTYFHPQLPKGKIDVFGSCNGLICLSCSGYFYICNPIIGEIFKLPKATIGNGLPQRYFPPSVGFGFDASINTYKVIHIYTSLLRNNKFIQTEVEIYTHGSGTWRKINNDIPVWFDVRRHCTHKAVFVRGVLHWIACFGLEVMRYCEIVGIDIEAETFKSLKMPTWISSIDTTLMSLGERLSFVEQHNCQTIVWIMHNYGNQESWTKEYIINHELLHPLPPSFQILRMISNDRILLHGHYGEGCYNVTKNERMKHFHFRGLPLNYVNLDVVVHVGSLISPGRLAKC